MTKRLLLVGDQHIRCDNLNAVTALEVWIVEHHAAELAAGKPLNYVVLMGDLLDRHSHVEQPLLARANRLIRHCLALQPPVHLVILVGNHDMAHNQVFLTPDHWLIVYRDWANERLTIVDEPTELAGLPNLLFMPYVPDGRFVEALDTRCGGREVWTAKFKLILCHQSFTNIKGIGHLLVEADTWLPTMPMTMSGHIHDPHLASHNLRYIGSYIPVSNGETNEKFLWIVDYDSDGVQGEPLSVPVNFLSRKTVVATIEQLKQVLQAQPLNPEQHTRVVVSGTQAEVSAWTRGTEAAALRAQKLVKVIMKVLPEPTTAVVRPRAAIQGGEGGKEEEEKNQPVASFREMLEAAVGANAPEVQAVWGKFRAAHVNLF